VQIKSAKPAYNPPPVQFISSSVKFIICMALIVQSNSSLSSTFGTETYPFDMNRYFLASSSSRFSRRNRFLVYKKHANVKHFSVQAKRRVEIGRKCGNFAHCSPGDWLAISPASNFQYLHRKCNRKCRNWFE